MQFLQRAEAQLNESVLRALDPVTRKQLFARAVTVELDADQYLFHRDDESDALYFLLEGEIEISSVTRAGKEVIYSRIRAPAFIGEFGVMDGAGRSGSAQATMRSKLLKIGRADSIRFLTATPTVTLLVLKILVSRLRSADITIERLRSMDSESRLALVLLEESEHGKKKIALNQSQIARFAGCTRETVNRKLSAWRNSGAIEISETGVRVKNTRIIESVLNKSE